MISGPAAEISESLAPLKEAGAKLVVPLKVSGAFHSRMMEDPAIRFGEFLKDFSFQTSIPVYANVTAVPYPDSSSIPETLVDKFTVLCGGQTRFWPCVPPVRILFRNAVRERF